ncbi:MAG: PAS domain S-box protein [Chthoniobacteraceae bacterium]
MLSEPTTKPPHPDRVIESTGAEPVVRSVTVLALRGVLAYALVGGLWMVMADQVMKVVVAHNAALAERLRLLDLGIFLILTATVMFFLLRRRLGRWEEQRKAREAAVEERLQLEQRLSKLAGVAPDVMFSFRMDLNGHFSFPFANRQIEEFFMVTVESLLKDGGPAIAAIHEEDLPPFLAAVEFSRDTLTAFRQELRLNHPERGVIHIDVHSMPEREDDGGTLWHGFFRDVTERHEAQAQVREMAGLLHAVVEQSTDAVFVKDHAGRYLLFNEAAAGFVGRSVPEVLGRDDRELFDAESAATITARDRRVMATGVAETEEETVTTTEGVQRTFLAMKAPFRDSDGEIVGTIGISRDITERNQAAVALRESEERLAFALEATLDGIWDWNVQTGHVYFSTQWARLLGYEREEIPQRIDFYFKILHPDDTERAKKALEDHLGGKMPGRQDEVRLRTKSGNYRWFLDRGRVVNRDSAGQPLRMLGTISDITARKRAESFTEEHMRVLETIASGAPVEKTLDALLRLVEEQCEEMLCAVVLLDADGTHLRAAAAPRIPRAFQQTIDGLALGPEVGSCGAAVFRQDAVFVEDGATHPLWATFRDCALECGLRAGWSTPIFDRDREVLGCFAVYYREPGLPTEEHRRLIDLATHTAAVAISRHRSETALRESERQYRQLIGGLPVALYTADAEGYITLFNEAAEKLWGRSPQPGVDRWSGAFALYTADGDPLPHTEHPISMAIREARTVRGVELAAERPDGTRIHFLAYPNPICDQNGRITGAMNVMVDITERKAAEAALQKAYDDLRQTQEMVVRQERLRAFGEMASGVAHDINNAICPISIYTAVLLNTECGLSDRARGFIEIVQQVAQDVGATVARLRDFYRTHDGPRGTQAVNLAALVGEVVALTRPRWIDMALERGAAIEVRTEIEADRLQIAGAESEIREALVNLVFNAVDAMPQGGRLTIRAGMTRPRLVAKVPPVPPRLFVEVEDTGLGMDEETRLRCLEPFYTTKGEQGTGLGLAIVCGILQRHDGKIAIESAPGIGTSIRLLFPVPVVLADGAPEPHVPEALPPMKILVVDDDIAILSAMHVALEAEDHDAHCVGGGQAGIDAFHAALEAGEPFDVVFTNLGMPKVDGRKVAAAVKAASPETPVILLTGWGHSMQADGDIPAGVDRIVSKPATPRDLNEALAACCLPQPSAS